MFDDRTIDLVLELCAATEATSGVGPIPELHLGQPAALFNDD